jgi:hypothetical protein
MQKGTAPYLKFAAAGARWRRIWQKCTDEAPHFLCRDSPRARSHHLLYSGYLGHRSGSPDSYSSTAPEPRNFKVDDRVVGKCKKPLRCANRFYMQICRSTLNFKSTHRSKWSDAFSRRSNMLEHNHHHHSDRGLTHTQQPSTCERTQSSRPTPSRSSAESQFSVPPIYDPASCTLQIQYRPRDRPKP